MTAKDNMNSSPAWTAARDQCWRTVRTATEMAELINKLEPVNVAQVMILLSDIQPSLLITLDHSDEQSTVELFIKRISSVLEVAVREWTSIESGMYYTLRLKYHGITIDVATMIPTRVENKFQLL